AHVLRVAMAGGESQQRTVEGGAGDAVSLVFEPTPAAPAPAPAPAPPVPVPPPPVAPRPTAPRPWMLVVAASATAITTGLTSASGAAPLPALRPADAAPTAEPPGGGQARQERTNGGIGVPAGLAALTFAGTFWWAAARRPRGAEVSVGIAPPGMMG